MFQGLRQNSLFYILEKSGEKPTLRIGQVIEKSNNQPKYPNTYLPNQNEETVDVKVQVDEEQLNFEKLPATAQIVNFGNNGVIVSDSKEAMSAEIDAMLRRSKGIVESVDYHKSVVSACEEMLTRINPQIAKEKQQEQDISNLKSDVCGMKGDMTELKGMMSQVLKQISNIKK